MNATFRAALLLAMLLPFTACSDTTPPDAVSHETSVDLDKNMPSSAGATSVNTTHRSPPLHFTGPYGCKDYVSVQPSCIDDRRYSSPVYAYSKDADGICTQRTKVMPCPFDSTCQEGRCIQHDQQVVIPFKPLGLKRYLSADAPVIVDDYDPCEHAEWTGKRMCCDQFTLKIKTGEFGWHSPGSTEIELTCPAGSRCEDFEDGSWCKSKITGDLFVPSPDISCERDDDRKPRCIDGKQQLPHSGDAVILMDGTKTCINVGWWNPQSCKYGCKDGECTRVEYPRVLKLIGKDQITPPDQCTQRLPMKTGCDGEDWVLEPIDVYLPEPATQKKICIQQRERRRCPEGTTCRSTRYQTGCLRPQDL